MIHIIPTTKTVAEMLVIAERIAREAHTGQKDKAGADYILHVERVVRAVVDDEAKIVAWLHDVIEDTDITADQLIVEGISPRLVHAVILVSRKDETYDEYIKNILASRNPLARAVKIEDLHDHLRKNEHYLLPLRMRQRYHRALLKLTGIVPEAAEELTDVVS